MNWTSWRLIIPAIIIFVLAAFVAYHYSQKKTEEQNATAEASLPPAGFENTPSPSPSPVAGKQPDTGSNTAQVKNLGIRLSSPTDGSTISSPVEVSGQANVLDGQVQIRVVDINGNVLGQGQATACLGLDACPFDASITFKNPQTATGMVQVASGDYHQSSLINF